MKWPESLTLIRHDTSAYNVLKEKRKDDPLYLEFLAARKRDSASDETRRLALQVQQKFALNISDANTPLVDEEGMQSVTTGEALGITGKVPDVIFVSPYSRALLTLRHMTRGWPALKQGKLERLGTAEFLCLWYNKNVK